MLAGTAKSARSVRAVMRLVTMTCLAIASAAVSRARSVRLARLVEPGLQAQRMVHKSDMGPRTRAITSAGMAP